MTVTQEPTIRGGRRRREEPAVRKAQIISAARTCFANAGFQATTVDHIAAEAGVSVGLLYRIFTSKAAIVEAIILDEVESQAARAFDIISASPGPGIDRAEFLRSLKEESLDLRKVALMFEIAAEACRSQALRLFVQKRRAELHSVLINRLADSGMDRRTAEQRFAELDFIGAIASGAVVQSITDTRTTVLESIEAILEVSDRKFSIAKPDA